MNFQYNFIKFAESLSISEPISLFKSFGTDVKANAIATASTTAATTTAAAAAATTTAAAAAAATATAASRQCYGNAAELL